MTDPLASLRARIDAAKAKAADSGIPYCPHKPTPPQARFLALETFEALYGGAAGGGKSDCLLMDHLRWCDRPGYSGLILRRTLPDLALPGAIMDRAKSWLVGRPGVTWNEIGKVFRFSSGARLQFGFCETPNDVYRYQGSEFHRVSIDELTQWPEAPYRYLMSRIRRKAGDTIPLAMRAATNPGGIGHAWVKRRFVSPGDPSRAFVPAKLTDNPHLNAEEYERNLALLDEVTRAQLRDGQWIDSGEGLVYRFERNRNLVDDLPETAGWHPVLGVDLGASEIKPTTAFALTFWHEDHPQTVVVKGWAEAGLIPSTIAERIQAVIALYPECRVVMDIGALGAGYANEMRVRHRIPVEPAEKQNKLGFRKLLNGALERSEVLLFAPECVMLVEELEALQWAAGGLDNDKSQPNHCSDALLYAWRAAQSWRAAWIRQPEELSEEQAWERRIKDRYEKAKRDPLASW